jgi:hypothetical protein
MTGLFAVRLELSFRGVSHRADANAPPDDRLREAIQFFNASASFRGASEASEPGIQQIEIPGLRVRTRIPE